MRQIVFEGVTFTNCGDADVTEAVLEMYEKEKRTKLPDDFRQFLIQVNGGKPDPCGCKRISSPEPRPGNNFNANGLNRMLQFYPDHLKKDAKEFWKRAYMPTRIDKFYPLYSPIKTRITLDWLDYPFFPNHPDTRSLINIATVNGLGDDHLYISTSDEFFGHIYIGKHYFGCETKNEEDSTGKPLKKLANDLVATSFTDLLRSLFSGDLILDDGYAPAKETLKFCDYLSYAEKYGDEFA